MEKTYCPECRTDTTFSVERKKMNCTFKDQLFDYEGDVAYCDNCGCEIWVSELQDANLMKIYLENICYCLRKIKTI